MTLPLNASRYEHRNRITYNHLIMSGHSHWSGIKHKKAVADAKRAQIFTKLGRAISVTARNGGGNPEFNPALRLAIEKARSFNMPKDKIENSIAKGTGEGSDSKLEEAEYEALGPFGTMLIIQTITDNKNRTVSDLRRTLENHGGKMADGGISWNFKRVGIINIVPSPDQKEEIFNLAIENDADDIWEKNDSSIKIVSNLEKFNSLKEIFARYSVRESGLSYVSKNPVTLNSKQKEKYDKLIESLIEHPDVQEVFDNVQDG